MNTHMTLAQDCVPWLGCPGQVAARDNSTTSPRVSLMTEFTRSEMRYGRPTGTTSKRWVAVDLTPDEARAVARDLLRGADEADAFTGQVTR